MTLSSLRNWLLLLIFLATLVGWSVGADQPTRGIAPLITLGILGMFFWAEIVAEHDRSLKELQEVADLLREVVDWEWNGVECEEDCMCATCRAGRWLAWWSGGERVEA